GSEGSALIWFTIVAAIGAQAYALLGDSFVRGWQRFDTVAWANFVSAAARLVGLTGLWLFGGSVLLTLGVLAGSNLAAFAWLLFAIWLMYRSRSRSRKHGGDTPAFRRRIIDYASNAGLAGLLAMVVWNYVEVFL